MHIGEYCNREVVIISRDETPLEAVRLMREHHVGDVIIVEDDDGNNKPCGIVTDRDIALEIVGAEVDPNTVTVIDLARGPLVTVHENDDLTECIVSMKCNAVRRVPVVDDNGYLVGILAIDDIVEILSEHFNDVVSLTVSQPINEQRALV